ncbi:MAG: hypothetical protein AAF518_21675 [Spirochaetota bacterium]
MFITNSAINNALVYVRSPKNAGIVKKLKCPKTGSEQFISPDKTMFIAESGFHYICIYRFNSYKSLQHFKKVTMGRKKELYNAVGAAYLKNNRYVAVAYQIPGAKMTSTKRQSVVITVDTKVGKTVRKRYLPFKVSRFIQDSENPKKMFLTGENAYARDRKKSKYTEAVLFIF